MKRYVFAGLAMGVALLLLGEELSAQKGKKEDLPPPRKEDVPKYMAILQKSQVAKDRAMAAEMLGEVGKINLNHVKEAVIPLVTSMKKDIDSSVRIAAAESLGNLATQPDKVLPALKEMLADKNTDVALAAARAFAGYGPEAKPYLKDLQVLKKKLNDKKFDQIINDITKRINTKV